VYISELTTNYDKLLTFNFYNMNWEVKRQSVVKHYGLEDRDLLKQED